jgi:pilus assembly protein CpaC
MTGVLNGTYRALVPIMLCGFLHAQTAPGAAVASTPAASSVATLNLATLPDANTGLTSSTEFASHSLHLLVGRSIFIKTPTRLKRVYVSNPLVVDSFTSSPTRIVVTARTPGVSSLILWDEAGQSETYLISSDVDVASLQKEIAEAFPSDNIKVEVQQDRVTLSGTAWSDASSVAAVKLAALYGKDVVNSVIVRQPHIKQVKLKVQIIEIDRTKMEQFGINFFSGGKNTSAVQTGQYPGASPTAGSTPLTLTVSSPLNVLFYNASLNIGLTIEDLQGRQVAQILAEPTITTLSGQKASFLSGGEFPLAPWTTAMR